MTAGLLWLPSFAHSAELLQVGIMEALISGALLASLSGLTAVAFNHPKAFAKLYPFLNLSVTVAFLGITIWQAAVHVTWTGVEPYVDAQHLTVADLERDSLVLPYVWVCVIYTLLLILFWVNLNLPRFIRRFGSNEGRVAGTSGEVLRERANPKQGLVQPEHERGVDDQAKYQ